MAIKVQGLESDSVTWTTRFQIEEGLGDRHFDMATQIAAHMLIEGWKSVRVIDSLGVVYEEGRPV
jgi:hypothetical protein